MAVKKWEKLEQTDLEKKKKENNLPKSHSI